MSQRGFDALRIRTGSRPSFKGLEMGDPLVAVEPSEVREEDGELVVYLPRRVTRQTSGAVRRFWGRSVRLCQHVCRRSV